MAEVERVADDVGLEDYGISSLQELAVIMTQPEERRCWRPYDRYQRVSALCLSLLAMWSQMQYGTKG